MNVAIYAAAMATLVICIIRAYARAVRREEEIRRQEAERERRARERSRAEQEYHRTLNKAVTVNPNPNYRPPIGKPLPPDVRKDMAQYMNASLYTHADMNKGNNLHPASKTYGEATKTMVSLDAYFAALDKLAQAQIEKATAKPEESKPSRFPKTIKTSEEKRDMTEYLNLPLPKHNSTATLTINTMADTNCIQLFSISDYLKEHEKELELKPRVCPQCGAPVRGKVCEYCDTQFR